MTIPLTNGLFEELFQNLSGEMIRGIERDVSSWLKHDLHSGTTRNSAATAFSGILYEAMLITPARLRDPLYSQLRATSRSGL